MPPLLDTIVNGLVKGMQIGQAALSALATREIVRQDRDEGIRRLMLMTESLSAEEFDAFEAEFMNHTLMFADPAKRLRAMELYAMLKFLEMQKFGTFRGFSTPGGPLP